MKIHKPILFLSMAALFFAFQNCGGYRQSQTKQIETDNSSDGNPTLDSPAEPVTKSLADVLPAAHAKFVSNSILSLGLSSSDGRLGAFLPVAGCTFERLNWSVGYKLVALIQYYELTGDEQALDTFVLRASRLLQQRNAQFTVSGVAKPYGWKEPGSGYVWTGFTGHLHIPLLMFAQVAQAHPGMMGRRPSGSPFTYGELVTEIEQSFDIALKAHAAEYSSWASGGVTQAGFRFQKSMPSLANCNELESASHLNGTLLPVNMNSIMFTAILLRSYTLESKAAYAQEAQRLRNMVAAYARYLVNSVFQRTPFQNRMVIYWNYNEIFDRLEDLPHSNATVRFATEAYRRNLVIDSIVLRELGNTFYTVLPATGAIATNSLHPNIQINGIASRGIYYWPLLVHYNGDLRVKMKAWIQNYRPHFEALISYAYSLSRLNPQPQ